MATASFKLCQGDPATWGTPDLGKTFLGVNEDGQIAIKQNDGTITILANSDPSAGVVSTSSGTTTVNPTAAIHTQVINVQGTARTVPVILPIGVGKTIDLTVTFPELPNFLLEIRNADGSGTVLATFDNSGDPIILSANYRFALISGAWVLIAAQIPSY